MRKLIRAAHGTSQRKPFRSSLATRRSPEPVRCRGAQRLCTTRCTTGPVFAAQRSGATISLESPAGLAHAPRSTLGTGNVQVAPCRPGPVGWACGTVTRTLTPRPVVWRRRLRPTPRQPSPTRTRLCSKLPRKTPRHRTTRDSMTATLAPAIRTRPAGIDQFREQTRPSRHARFAGATDNGRRERPDGPIWISVSICGQTPQS